ncbi:MAG: NAD(P)/FAD-dependent oxidoreductase [Candidatus Nanopelagicales bacterium]
MSVTTSAYVGESFPYGKVTSEEAKLAVAKAKPEAFWLDDVIYPEPMPALAKDIYADLVIIGGGFTGLWTALLASEEKPSRKIVLLEAEQIGDGAAGRNGGFVSASITHGFANGFNRWPEELAKLVRMGHENLAEIEDFINRNKIDCDFQWYGEMNVAITEDHAEELAEMANSAISYGENFKYLNQDEVSKIIKSPLYKGGLFDEDVAIVDPARLVWGLRRVALQRGIQIHENTWVDDIDYTITGVKVKTSLGSVKAPKAIVATGAEKSLIKEVNKYVVPVYDYALMTEPLTEEQWEQIGWTEPIGFSDVFNQFHYFRPTVEGRILWGGYDAVYHYGAEVNPDYDFSDESFAMLAEHFYRTFPTLRGIGFTHKWGGAIDTCSRFAPFWGTAFTGRVAYVAGFTGLGVGSSRFAAKTMLDLLYDRKTERTKLKMVKTKPFRFPPEPFKFIAINLTRWSLDRADKTGKRNLWLKLIDKLGFGFDS